MSPIPPRQRCEQPRQRSAPAVAVENTTLSAIVLRHSATQIRVFKTRPFVRFARSEEIADDVLIEAVTRAIAGRVAKSDRDNIGGEELRAFRKLAVELLRLDDRALGPARANGTITEVDYHD